MKTTDTALLGHVGDRYLAATALSDLWTQSFGVFLMGHIMGVFAGQAYGAKNYDLVGIWLQVSLFVIGIISIPVLTAWAVTGPVLSQIFGESAVLSNDAWYYAAVLIAAIPARLIAGQINSFLQVQQIMHPSVITSMIAMVFNLVFGLIFVLGIPIPGFSGYGFPACPIVTVGMEWLQLSILLTVFIGCQQLHRQCWPGFSWSHITAARVKTFFAMYLPAALSIGSDFWRMAAVGAVAATLGSIDLAVFNASYRIMWICMTFTGSLAGAIGIKLGIAFGSGSARTAKYITTVGLSVIGAFVLLLGLVVWTQARRLGAIFSSDAQVLDLFEEAALPLAGTTMLMNLAVALERVPMTMGRTKVVLVVGLLGSWAGQVPCALLFTQLWRRDLYGLYTGVAAGYCIVVALFVGVIWTSDFQQYAEEAQERSEVKRHKEHGTPLASPLAAPPAAE